MTAKEGSANDAYCSGAPPLTSSMMWTTHSTHVNEDQWCKTEKKESNGFPGDKGKNMEAKNADPTKLISRIKEREKNKCYACFFAPQ